ncbi:uncharacterized protein LOC105829644 isoform X1 [Monomorium pharaonis]|uniref:uncharacterized protein LOC105829644 isoform X1 n=1 Tax=Monomorium pharaonis TaxID=307658 RepID=UPI001746E22C|nr:uncharacterized protein LOC105829644 isoform X1 [Monomorium pharaonis]
MMYHIVYYRYNAVSCLANNCDVMRFLDLNSIFYVFLSCDIILTNIIGFLVSKTARHNVSFTSSERNENRFFRNNLLCFQILNVKHFFMFHRFSIHFTGEFGRHYSSPNALVLHFCFEPRSFFETPTISVTNFDTITEDYNAIIKYMEIILEHGSTEDDGTGISDVSLKQKLQPCYDGEDSNTSESDDCDYAKRRQKNPKHLKDKSDSDSSDVSIVKNKQKERFDEEEKSKDDYEVDTKKSKKNLKNSKDMSDSDSSHESIVKNKRKERRFDEAEK